MEMMEKPFCSYFVLSPTRTLIETLIIPAVFLVYVPQYIAFRQRGTVGISPGCMLAFFVFSTAQFSCRLLNRNTQFAVHCIQEGKLEGVEAFSALIGYLQVGAQWVGAFVLLFCFAASQVDADEGETAPILSSEEPAAQETGQAATSEAHWTERLKMSEVTSDHLVFIACSYALVLLSLSLILLIVPGGHTDLAALLFRAILEQALLYLSLATTLASLVVLCLLYVYDPAAKHRSGALGWSNLFLTMQTVTFLVLGLFQAFRPGFIDPNDGHWEWEWLYWYLRLGHVGVHYLILAIGIGYVLGMRLTHSERTV